MRMPSIEPGLVARVKSSSGWPSVVGSRGSAAARALRRRAQSSTHRAIGPIESSDQLSRMVPESPIRPNVTLDRKSTRLNSSHQIISYAVFCLKKKKHNHSRHNNVLTGEHVPHQPRLQDSTA